MNTEMDLHRVTSVDYGDRYREDWLAMYHHYADSADKISDRRHQANSLFLSINTLLITVAAKMLETLEASTPNFLWVAALAGVLFSFAWFILLRQYRSLNTAKFKVLHEMEKELPAAPYDAEWEMLEEGKKSKIHIPLSKVEAFIPIVFVFLHGFIFVRAIEEVGTHYINAIG